MEDTSLAVGEAIRTALGDKVGIRRFGDAYVPLDETACHAAVDLSGRPYLVHEQPEIVELIGTFDTHTDSPYLGVHNCDCPNMYSHRILSRSKCPSRE